MQYNKWIALLVTASMLTACTEPNGAPARGVLNGGHVSKSDIGTTAGVIGGAVIGSTIGGGAGRAVAVVGGGLLGGLLGNQIGQSLDNADRAEYARASQAAMNNGSTQSWKNSSTGHRGTIHPQKRFKNSDGQYCREYTQTIYVEGKPHQGHGTACRQSDGAWDINE